MRLSLSNVGMILFLGIMTAITPFSMDTYLPALPELQEEMGISPSVSQLTLTMTIVGMAVGQLVGGPLSDMKGRKKPLLLGMSVFTASSFFAIFAKHIGVFLILRFMQGFFGSFGLVIARAIARDVKEGSELLQFYSILMLINGLAPIVAPIIGGQILRFTDWHGVFYALTGLGIILVLSTVFYKETLPEERRISSLGTAFKSFPELMKDSYFLGQCLIQGFLFVSFFGYLAGSSFLFEDIYGLSASEYSYILGGVGIGLLLTGLLPAKLANVVPAEKLLYVSILTSFIGSLILFPGLYNLWPLWYVIPAIVITIIPLSIIETTGLAMAVNRQGEKAGSASALIGFFTVAMGGLTMPLVGIGGKGTAVPLGLVIIIGYTLCLVTFERLVRGK